MFSKKILGLLLGVFICSISLFNFLDVQGEVQKIFYVSPDGNDLNSGTETQPFASLEKARDAIRELKNSSGLPVGGIKVYLRQGEYNLTNTFTLTPQDSGEAGSPIIYEAYPGEKPVITGGREINGWTKLTTQVPGITNEAAGNLWVADVQQNWRTHYLYVNGESKQVARKYNTDIWSNWYKFYNNQNEYGPAEPGGQLYKFRDDVSLENLPNNGDVEMNLLPVRYWNTIAVIKDIDTVNNTVRAHSKNPYLPWIDTLDPYQDAGYCNLLNAIPFLDEPGEWCINSQDGKIYYWPEDGTMNGKEAIAPVLYELIRFQGDEEQQQWQNQVHHIELRGLTLMYTDRMPEDQWPDEWLKRNCENPDAALVLQGARDCIIEGNVISKSGTYAITLNNYAQRISIIGNELNNLGCGGIQIFGYGPGTTDLNKNHVIERNYIHDTGEGGYSHSASISIYGSNNNTIKYNYIYNIPYIAINISGANYKEINKRHTNSYSCFDTYGNCEAQYKLRFDELPDEDLTRESARQYYHSDNNVIEYNIVDEYMMLMDDGGALYAWFCGNNNIYNKNIVYKSNPGKHMLYPLYMDDGVDNTTISNNMVWSSGQNLNKGDNQWLNNETSYPSAPTGFYPLFNQIVNTTDTQGGWLNATSQVSLSDSHLVLRKGTKKQLSLMTTISSLLNKNSTFTWQSSDSSVAVVDTDGIVTAISEGIATIRGTSTIDSSYYVECEVDVKDIPIAGQNLALHKNVAVTSVEAGTSYTANQAVDGNSSTRWSSNHSDTEAIYIDLGQEFNIDSVVLKWEAAYGVKYKIQVSDDTVNWTDIYVQNAGNGDHDDINFTSVNTRYVRMYGIQRYFDTCGYSLWEFEVYENIPSSGENLAFNKTITSSSVETGTEFHASNAVDGILTTRWSSNFNDSEWINVDLGNIYNIDRVKLKWEYAFGKEYKIQVSNDAVSWTDVYSNTIGDGGTDDVFFTPIDAKYVRMYGLKRGTEFGYSIFEFQVYGN
ncbi:hypothetical protein AN1V17_28330 [Vallitalea sediminicola]